MFSLLSMFCEKEGLLCLRNAENGETIMKLSKDGVFSGQSEFIEKYMKAKETMDDDVGRAERIYNFYKAKDCELKNIIG